MGINRLGHLTKLDTKDAVVQIEQPCLFSSSLQALSIERGDFHVMQGERLSQCTALQSLSLTDCCVSCSTPENTLDIANSPAKLSGGLSALPQLTSLYLNVCSMMSGVFECPWPPQLTTLRQLSLELTKGFVASAAKAADCYSVRTVFAV
ncbi:hypothetical protein ABBQ32_006463 [Trebouxia sp. C0010 RCD-2024]